MEAALDFVAFSGIGGGTLVELVLDFVAFSGIGGGTAEGSGGGGRGGRITSVARIILRPQNWMILERRWVH